jgi:hypothetical protein
MLNASLLVLVSVMAGFLTVQNIAAQKKARTVATKVARDMLLLPGLSAIAFHTGFKNKS